MATDAQIQSYLENCMRHQTLAHAYSFIGPTSSERKNLLAGFLSDFFQTKSLDHPDIRLVTPEKDTITIEQIRDLKQWLTLSPLAGANKAAIIETAEKMNEASQNAFLKVLEEPVPNTYIFLLVSHRRSLLPTIFSRTVPLYFTNSSGKAQDIDLLQPFLASADPGQRLRLWLQSAPEKEEIRDWLAKIVPELRALLLKSPSAKLAKSIRSLLEALSGPTGQNWSLIAENLLISI